MKNLRYWMRGLMLSLAVTIFMLYLGEAVLRVVFTDPGFAMIEQAEREGRPFDPRSRMEVVQDLRNKGVDAVPRLVPSALRQKTHGHQLRSRITIGGKEVLPLGGISRKTTVLCNETGSYATYESDEHGFRNPMGWWESETVELVLLGDSFTIGECVASEEALGDLIRRRFPATLNLGYSGHCPLFELATLVEYGPALNPRRVLWFYFENDLRWFDLGKGQKTPLLMRYVGTDFKQGLLGMQPEIDASLTSLVESMTGRPSQPSPVTRMQELRGSAFHRLASFLTLKKLRITIGQFRNRRSRATLEPPNYELYEAVMRQMKSTVNSWGGELTLVYLPGVRNFESGGRFMMPETAQTYEWIKKLARLLGVQMIDVKAAMHTHEDPLSFYSYRGSTALGPPHMSADGYAFTARVVLEHLLR